jgi:AI-2 transport protein TqsA
MVGVIAAVCVIWLFRAASIVTIPLAAAFFITIVVHPVQVYLHRRVPRPRWAALALTMALIAVLVGGVIWAMAESLDEAVEAAPRHADRLEQIRASVEAAARSSGVTLPQNLLSSPDMKERLGGLAASALRATWELASGLVLVFFLVLLMLLEAPIWSANTRRVLRSDRAGAALATVAEIAEKVRQYLYVRTILGLMSAAAAGVWLLLLDVDLVLIWVVLTFALNYIPNLGSIIAVFPPSLMALVQHGPVLGLVTLGGLAVFEQIIGNFIDPRMQGRRLQISPAVVLVALVFWSWLWGPVGALLAVPMTVTLLAAAAHVPDLRPFTTLVAAEREAGEERG